MVKRKDKPVRLGGLEVGTREEEITIYQGRFVIVDDKGCLWLYGGEFFRQSDIIEKFGVIRDKVLGGAEYTLIGGRLGVSEVHGDEHTKPKGLPEEVMRSSLRVLEQCLISRGFSVKKSEVYGFCSCYSTKSVWNQES